MCQNLFAVGRLHPGTVLGTYHCSQDPVAGFGERKEWGSEGGKGMGGSEGEGQPLPQAKIVAMALILYFIVV